ncbi:MAG TPA: TIGR02270 family protein [Steroidobacteraceae bacterium]|nr:TIGR02270 family protein [Steroidobacteraceae bacterium]
MAVVENRINPWVVAQHAEESAHLRNVRTQLLTAPHIQLPDLGRHDERISAHLDGVALAGDAGFGYCEQLLENPGAGEIFAATVRAIEDGNPQRLGQMLAVAPAATDGWRGLCSALGWVSATHLAGIARSWLASDDPVSRLAGITACALHRVDPGLIAGRRLEDNDLSVRARSLRTAGELGKRELVSATAAAIGQEDPDCQFWAAYGAVLLGAREASLQFLVALAMKEGPRQLPAFQLALLAMSVTEAHDLLRQLSGDPAALRRLIRGAGLAGDPNYIPWLISRMADDALARAAGESFSLVTGLDLAQPDFERSTPGTPASGPTDDPEDDNVALDPDDDLPWPEQAKVQAWWNQNGARFTTGVRHFMGVPPSRAHCIEVLKNGYQRQRIAAAYHLCLLDPGTPLFEWRAPAWRQQRELAQLT